MLIRDIKQNFIDMETRKRVKEHLANINDLISVEDIQNAKTNWTSDQFINDNLTGNSILYQQRKTSPKGNN